MEQRLADIEAKQALIAKQLADGDERMNRMERSINENTTITLEIKALLDAFKQGFRVLGWLGSGLKGLAIFIGPFIALYITIKKAMTGQ